MVCFFIYINIIIEIVLFSVDFALGVFFLNINNKYMSRLNITNKIHNLVKSNYLKKTLEKEYIKPLNKKLCKNDIDYDYLARGLGRSCYLNYLNKYNNLNSKKYKW